MRWRLLPLIFLPLVFGGAANERNSELVDAYMSGDWTTVEALLKDKQAMRGQEADVNAVRVALTEVRPAWWEGVKAGKKTAFHPSLYGRTYAVTYDPDLKSSMQLAVTNGVPALSVMWNAGDMDSREAGEHGFSKGDLTDLAIFATLGSITSWAALPPAEKALDESGKLALARYLYFRGNCAAIAYANPPGRRWGNYLFLAAYKADYAKLETRMGRKALGALLIHEVLMHPEIYKSLPLPEALDEKRAEERLAVVFADHLEKNAWTFAEDNAFRTAAKQFANANTQKTAASGIVRFPSKLTMSLNPAGDEPLQAKRDAWVKAQLEKVKR
jgi:hypothetical protein